jgi:hypothetical protein
MRAGDPRQRVGLRTQRVPLTTRMHRRTIQLITPAGRSDGAGVKLVQQGHKLMTCICRR